MSRAAGNLVFRAAPTRLLSRARLTARSRFAAGKVACTPSKTDTPRPFHGSAVRRDGFTLEQDTGRLPEFSLKDKVIVVTGAGRGLGLVQAEALLEAGAKVYAFDRLEKPDPDFHRVQERAAQLGTSLEFRRLDVRDNISLNATVAQIAEDNGGRLDGLLACAGIQQETSALDYTMEDADKMFGVNITGVFMTAQAVARQMKKLERPGSMVFIASMSAHIANKGLICPYVALMALPPLLIRVATDVETVHTTRPRPVSSSLPET